MSKRVVLWSVAVTVLTVLAIRLVGQTASPERQLVLRAAEALGGLDRVMALKTLQIIGYGELFELYSRSFDMERFWALTIILFAAAMLLSAAVEHFEKRIEYYAGAR